MPIYLIYRGCTAHIYIYIYIYMDDIYIFNVHFISRDIHQCLVDFNIPDFKFTCYPSILLAIFRPTVNAEDHL